MLDFDQILLLCSKQKNLDDFIISENSSEDVLEKNYFALKIELYEFINELSVHKHWKKKPFSQIKAQEELIDMLHFSLFLLYRSSVDFNSKVIKNIYDNFENYELNLESILKLESTFLKMYKNRSYLEIVCFIEYLNSILFNSDLFLHYDLKYKKNIERQKQNY